MPIEVNEVSSNGWNVSMSRIAASCRRMRERPAECVPDIEEKKTSIGSTTGLSLEFADEQQRKKRRLD